MSEKIVQVNCNDQFITDYRNYGLYILFRRVMTDIRDGLKPVQRRILTCMFKDIHAYGPDSNKVKSAAVVGTVIKTYHPHGDVPVYDAMKPMINDFEMNYPLIKGFSNFGTFQGDPAAAYRYTECKLSDFAIDCVLGDLIRCKECVDWTETFDGKAMEPEYLPVKVPLLLINGSFGIGIGDKAEIPSHNLSEVIDATLMVMDNPDAKITLAPDHCMPCEIFKTDFQNICNTGYGYYVIRGIIDIEKYNSPKYKNRTALVIKSIHNLLFLDTITEAIEKLVDSKKIVQIDNCFDESTIDQMRYVIVLKPGADPNYVRDVIYKNTKMQDRMRINVECVHGVEPLRVSYTAYIKAFLEMRKLTKFRIYANELQNIKTKFHEREALVKCLESDEIDYIINMIRKNKGTDDSQLIEYLVKKLNITDLQASYIINVNLKRLSLGYLKDYKEKMAEYMAQAESIMAKMNDDRLIENEIREELLYIKQKYGVKRKCKIVKDARLADIPEGEMIVGVTEKGFIKKSLFGGVLHTVKGDKIINAIKIDNTDNVLLFDASGKVFKIPVHQIPFSDKTSNGVDIRFMIKKAIPSTIIDLKSEAVITQINNTYRDTPNENHIITLSKDGYIKKLDLIDFTNVTPSGLTYSRVTGSEDSVCGVYLANNNLSIIPYSDKKAVRVNVADIPLQKRNTKGTKVIQADYIDGACVIDNESNASALIVITEHGYVNKLPFTCIPNDGKGKKGFNVIKLGRGDKIKFINTCNDYNVIRLTDLNNQYIDLNIGEIPSGSSVSPGTKIFSSRNGDRVAKLTFIQ